MGLSHNKPYRKIDSNKIFKETLGLTLIEVLIALAIMSIGMIAVMRSVTQTIRSSGYLQQKTIALFVGEDVIKRIQSGKPIADETIHFLSQKWYVDMQVIDTANPAIKELEVKLFPNKSALTNDAPILTLESYVHKES